MLLERNTTPYLKEVLQLIELVLIFHTSGFWSKLVWSHSKETKWKCIIRKLVEKFTVVFPRVDGNAWKIPKVHLLKHLPKNISKFGAVLNFDCTNG